MKRGRSTAAFGDLFGTIVSAARNEDEHLSDMTLVWYQDSLDLC